MSSLDAQQPRDASVRPPQERSGVARLAAPVEHRRHRGPRELRTSELVLHVDDLHKSYRGIEAVRGVSFEVRRGEVFGLLGPNGAGKTTTVEVLTGFRRRDRGTALVLGLDPGVRADVSRLRARCGVVFQQAGHYRYLTVRETLAMHRRYHAHPRSVEEVLDLAGLTDVAERRTRELSGGQQRRLDVGVALVGRPELIFLDEPTTGFDPAARRRAWDAISTLRDLGTTVVLTTHYMEEAQALVDRVAVLHRGRVVGTGTPAELAEQLRLASELSFTIPPSIALQDLPLVVRGGRVGQDGRLRVRCEDPTSVLAQLCGWAVARGVRLDDLQVAAPTLEASYLALTEDDGPVVASASEPGEAGRS